MVALLPNGRTIWLYLQPSAVPIRVLDRITEAMAREDLGRSQMLAENGAAVGRLAKRMRSDTTRLRQDWLKRVRKLHKDISSGDAKLQGRVRDTLKPAVRKVMASRKLQRKRIHRRQHRELWDQLVLLSAALLMAAYGRRGGNPLSENNLVIGLSLGVWLFGDELADRLAGKPSDKGSIKGLDVWSYTAPFANLLTGWWLLSGRQQERFITGTTDFKDLQLLEREIDADRQKHPYYVYAIEDLSLRIAPDHVEEFRRFQNVPVMAAIQLVEFADGSVDALHVSLHNIALIEGSLVIFVRISSLSPEVKRLQVAWVVDTQEPETRP